MITNFGKLKLFLNTLYHIYFTNFFIQTYCKVIDNKVCFMNLNLNIISEQNLLI